MSEYRPTPAEQHLGDRLAALVDGELKHDARDRVLAHLATCAKCKAEADAQRRLKDVFAQAAPPPPSEGLLARLQGLPAGPGGTDLGGPFSGGPFPGGPVIDAVFEGAGTPSGRPGGRRPGTFGYVPGAHVGAPVLPAGSGGGFRIHEVGRPESERSGSPWRGRRFAFAAASAVSFAAIALGGTLPLDGSVQQSARGGGQGNSVTPMRATNGTGASAAGAGVPAASPGARSLEYDRRRSPGGLAPARGEEQRAAGRPAPRLFAPTPPAPSLLEPLGVAAPALGPPLVPPVAVGLRLAGAPGITPAVTPAPSHLVAPTDVSPPTSP